jgi:serine/threonine protein kinase
MRPLEPGLTLRSFRLVRLLGFGGAGQVWLAHDNRGQSVALKARPRLGGADEHRFRQEFEKLRTLRIPGVVRVLDTGADQGYVFFTMDVAEGVPFTAFVQADRTLAGRVHRAARAGAQVARALAGVHRLGLAHRDIKPANVMVDEGGRATVLDFGTLRFGAASDSSSEFMGTVAYMSPEQRIGLPHDHNVDMYALGVTLHEALSGVPAGRWKPGRPRSSLALLGNTVPVALAWLVDRMLALDPTARPAADIAEGLLEAVAAGEQLAPAPWPSPPTFAGDASRLLGGSAVVVGQAGTGRRRLVQEARWQWYRKGYRSVAGVCVPDRPFSALRDVLGALFSIRDPAHRRALAGAEAPLLKALWPELPVPVGASAAWPPDPTALAEALARVLERVSPVAVILWDADDADIGTTAVLAPLVAAASDGVLVWATSQKPLRGLTEVRPLPWNREVEESVLSGILPDGAAPVGPPGATPLENCARAWRALAAWRGEPGPAGHIPEDLVKLSVLDEPFPWPVADGLVSDVEALVRAGHLIPLAPGHGGSLARSDTEGEDEPSETTDLFARRAAGEQIGPPRLGFADRGTRRLACARVHNPATLHGQAAQAWSGVVDLPEAPLKVVAHALRAGQPHARTFADALRRELQQGNPSEVDRWLQLRDLHLGGEDDFLTAYARLYSDFELRPATVRLVDINALGRRAPTAEDRGWVGILSLMHEARQGDKARAIVRGREWADKLASRHPEVASWMLREVALAHLSEGDVDRAVADCRDALRLAQAATEGRPQPMSTAEVNAATTLSAGLIYAERLDEAADFCVEVAAKCRLAGLARGEGAMLANAAIARLYLGNREDAAELAASCRAVQPRHRDPLVLAICAVTQARLAVEVGDLASGRTLLDEAMTTAQALDQGRILAEAWAIALEAAIQAAAVPDAQRALAAYGVGGASSKLDAWPASLARWLWLTGDLPGALRATEAPRQGHAARVVLAERCRLLLVAGEYAAATEAARGLAEDADSVGMTEIATFARLVLGAAEGVDDAAFKPLVRATRTSRWVHLYLGALHLDAIRRQLRGENVGALIRQLAARSRDVGHRLYEALAREDGW